ncbi:MAG: efflux RND transporter periplasmic adaptor subunit [Deltaproteobacteria bacterium]
MNIPRPKKAVPRLLPLFLLIPLIAVIFGLHTLIKDRKQALAEDKASAPAVEQMPVNVVVQHIVPRHLDDVLSLPGIALANEDLTIRAEVDGLVTAVRVKEGDWVEQGTVLVQLDQRDYLNALASIAAKQQLAESTFTRMRQLLDQHAVSQDEFDKAEASFKELKAARAKAELDLERATIRAPLAGIVNALPAKKGLLLGRTDPVAQILSIDPIKIEVAVPERDLTAARRIERCKVTIAALEGMQAVGRKIFLASQPQSAAMAYTMWLTLANNDHAIRPGMFAEVSLVRQSVEAAVAVPLYSVITGGDSKYVYVVENDIARKRSVSTGFLSGWNIHIEQGLAPDEQVVIVGHRNLEDGQRVNIVKQVTDSAEILP